MGPGKATIEQADDRLSITIPSETHPFVTLFIVVCLAGWAVGEWQAVDAIRGGAGGSLFLNVWLIGWTFGGLMAVGLFAWLVGGREQIVVRPNAISIADRAFGLGPAVSYDAARISNLRLLPNDDTERGEGWWAGVFGGGGRIAFDYDSETIRFASNIEESEAQAIIEQLKSRFEE